MKICQLCAVDFTLHRFLEPLMLAERDAGHEVVGVCADGPLLARVRDTGLRVETAPFSRDFNLARHARAYRRLVALFRAECFDMVHVHTPVAGLIGRLAAWRAGVPRIVYTAHGFYFHERMAWPKRALFIALEWLAGRVTDVLFTQAEEDAETARRHNLCPDGVIEAIGNGVDVTRFAPATDGGAGRRALRESLDTPDAAVVVVCVGRLVAEKGYAELFEAIRDVDAHLWVVGERLASEHARSIDDAIAQAQADPSLALRLRLLGVRVGPMKVSSPAAETPACPMLISSSPSGLNLWSWKPRPAVEGSSPNGPLSPAHRLPSPSMQNPWAWTIIPSPKLFVICPSALM